MEKEMDENNEKKRSLKSVIYIVVLGLLVFSFFVMIVNSAKPEHLTLVKADTKLKGSAFIRVNQLIIKQLHENWLSNDLFWPTVFLDNFPNFQLGELEVVRYNVRILRDNLTRTRTTDNIDPMIEGTFTALSNDPRKWMFPSSESKWEEAGDNLDDFYQNFLAGKSHFYPRADNLVELLTQYASLMGGVNTRLVNAPTDRKEVLNMDQPQTGGHGGSKMVDVDIPWYIVDDNFYYAQGISYALYESFKAIRIDFNDVLKDKNSLPLIDKIIENLGRCDFEPLVVFNGSLGSVFANHSMNLSGVFNDARQKVNSLISSLKQG